MPRFYTLPAQVIVGNGRVDSDAAVVFVKVPENQRAAIVIPAYKEVRHDSHQVEIVNLGPGEVLVSVDQATINGQTAPVRVPASTRVTVSSIPADAIEYILLPPPPPVP